MEEQLKTKIIEYWHISRTALATMPTVPTRWDRLNYVRNTLKKENPELVADISAKQLWLNISDTTTVF
jgi:hypothetical protein